MPYSLFLVASSRLGLDETNTKQYMLQTVYIAVQMPQTVVLTFASVRMSRGYTCCKLCNFTDWLNITNA